MVEALHLLPTPEDPVSSPLAGRVHLACRNLSVFAGRRPILEGVDLTVREGEVLALIGPSGAGKSTLLKALNRLVDLESPPLEVRGEVLFDGKDVYAREFDADELRREVGVLFQQPVIFPRSIAANVLFGLRHHERLGRARRRARLEEALREAALWEEVEDRLDEPAGTLSVGQQQRLCLARALAMRPAILLMDEPTSALDAHASAAIEELVLRLKGRHTLVLVTHDLGQARRVADRVACLCIVGGVGRVVETGASPEIFDRPRHRETAEFLRRESPPSRERSARTR